MFEPLEVFRYTLKCDLMGLRQFADRSRTFAQLLEDGAPRGIGQSGEDYVEFCSFIFNHMVSF